MVIKGHSLLERRSAQRGCLRPKPIECMVLSLSLYNLSKSSPQVSACEDSAHSRTDHVLFWCTFFFFALSASCKFRHFSRRPSAWQFGSTIMYVKYTLHVYSGLYLLKSQCSSFWIPVAVWLRRLCIVPSRYSTNTCRGKQRQCNASACTQKPCAWEDDVYR